MLKNITAIAAISCAALASVGAGAQTKFGVPASVCDSVANLGVSTYRAKTKGTTKGEAERRVTSAGKSANATRISLAVIDVVYGIDIKSETEAHRLVRTACLANSKGAS